MHTKECRENREFDRGIEAAIAGCPETYIPSDCWEKEAWKKGWKYGMKNKEAILKKQEEDDRIAKEKFQKKLREEKERLQRILNTDISEFSLQK